LMGAWQPVCNEEGEYKQRQCNYSARTCWCVGANGEEIDGSTTFYGGREHLLMTETSMCNEQQCFRLRKMIDNDEVNDKWIETHPEYYPQCDADGHFFEKQCLFGKGKCWCVDKKSGEKKSDVFEDNLNRRETKECSADGIVTKPDIDSHNQDGLHLNGVNIGEILEGFIQDQLQDGQFHPRPGFGKIVESLLEGSNSMNLNYAPVNTNVQNFIDVNTEIETEIDININGKKFGLESLMDSFAQKMKDGSDMNSMIKKLISCVKNFHLQEYIQEYLPIIREMAESKGINQDEFDSIIKQVFKHM
jgi:hypothetical protein